MFKKSCTWAKKKLLWFFLGGVALAAGIEGLPDAEQPVIDVPFKQTYFARVEDGLVKYVVTADQGWIDTAGGTSSGLWIEVRNDDASTKDDADIGDDYNASLKAFISPKPTEEATLDTDKAEWVIPKKNAPHPIEFYTASTTEI